MTALYVLGAVVALFVLDRALLRMEDRRWINYRRTKPSRGAIGYHLLEMSSAFEPSARVAQEVRVREEKREDESGAPPAGAPGAADPGL